MSLQESRRIKQKIFLDNKLQPYKKAYADSQKMFRHRSAHVRLADQIYSQPRTPVKREKKKKKQKQKRSQSQSPLQNKKLNQSKKRISSSRSSSSISSSKVMMQGLQDRTLYLSELMKKNCDLVMEKKELEQKILFYKQKIAYQKRKANQTEQNFKKLERQLEQTYHRIHKKDKRITQVIQNQIKQKEQISILKVQIDKKVEQNSLIKLNIEMVKQTNKMLKKTIKTDHNEIRQTSEHSSGYKNLLRQSQKKLANEMVHKQELANNKAILMIEANQIAKRIEYLTKF